MQFYSYLLKLIIFHFGLNGFLFESFIGYWIQTNTSLDWVIHKMKWLKQKQRYESNKTVSIFYIFFLLSLIVSVSDRMWWNKPNIQLTEWNTTVNRQANEKKKRSKHLFLSVICTVVLCDYMAFPFISSIQFWMTVWDLN